MCLSNFVCQIVVSWVLIVICLLFKCYFLFLNFFIREEKLWKGTNFSYTNFCLFFFAFLIDYLKVLSEFLFQGFYLGNFFGKFCWKSLERLMVLLEVILKYCGHSDIEEVWDAVTLQKGLINLQINWNYVNSKTSSFD